MPRSDDFDRSVAPPPGLSIAAIRKSIEYIERELDQLIDVYYEQANVFSALVGIYATKALDTFSEYEKSRHVDVAQQRFPDLERRGSGPSPKPEESLESKASKRPWAVQAHYDHPGWYIIWRYLVDPTRSLEPDRAVVVWRVDVAFLRKDDWKYEGAGQARQVAAELTPSASGTPRSGSAMLRYTDAVTSPSRAASRRLSTVATTAAPKPPASDRRPALIPRLNPSGRPAT
ncbi:MAG: hypothetical protein ACE5JM_06155 [Armatimonadota bacterium]